MIKRHEIQVLRAAGLTLAEIAERTGASERSVRRIVRESAVTEANEAAARRARRIGRPSKAAAFSNLAAKILAEEPDLPTGEVLRLLREKGYEGGKSTVYTLVRSLRSLQARPIVRFEGLAGEFSQHDFGEFAVTYTSGKTERIHFFASRLKYSRFAHVEVVPDQRVEALVRALLASFEAFGGVPLVSVFDNPKTVVLHRRGAEIEWNQTFGQAALDLRFAPELCWPRRANQKGAVENLVGWVKSSFFKVRRFVDRDDLLAQLAEWLHEANHVRPSRATGVPPLVRLSAERERLRPLVFKAKEYALRFPIMVGPTGLVEFDGRRYSMPPRAIGIPGTLYLFPETVRILAGPFEARHQRVPSEGKTSYRPEDRAATLAAVSGERARLYSKRQQLLDLGGAVEVFLTEIVHRRPRTWKGDVERLYDLLLRSGARALLAAIRDASLAGLFGAEHVEEVLAA